MEVTLLIQKLLSGDERCVICVQAGLVLDWLKSIRYLALVERKGDYALLSYSSRTVPCASSDDLILDSVLPIDRDLKWSSETPRNNSQGTIKPDIALSIKSSRGNLLLELPQLSTTQRFLAELSKSREVILRNTGIPPSFQWLEKYQNILTSPGKFNLAMFDPLSENDVANNTYYYNTTGSTGGSSLGFDDNFTDSAATAAASSMTNSMRMSGSRDSLDNLLDGHDEELTSSIDSLQRQLGLDSSASLPVGSKPVTARETFVKHYMTERQTEFTDLKNIRVFCGTWNVNNRLPEENLYIWLAPDDDVPDIYAIAFQELDLSNQALIFSESPREHEWLKHIAKYLHPNAKYKKVKVIRLVGIMLVVYIRQEHGRYVTCIDAETIATGIMGIMGNKGGVAIRFTLHNTSLCFINSHLAAHQDEFERRNQDYKDIDSKMRFKTFVPPLTIHEHDVTFWIGDLNYRIIELDINEVKQMIDLKLYNKLIQHDQLYRLLSQTDIFSGYSEAEINFDPTYKFDPGTDTWDTSDKCRVPAWCDRVLWQGTGVRQLSYTCHKELRISDHKPVSAVFETAVKVVDETRYRKVYEDVMKKLDRLENEYLPQVKLDNTEFEFENVKFIEPKSRVLTIANIGQRPVQFEFINKLDEDMYCKPWLSVSPFKSIIMPGFCCEITLEVYVDKLTAWKLNAGDDKIEDILVLHLHGGKDFFVPISGSYIPSSYGSSIEALIQMHRPIIDVPIAELVELESPGSLKHFSQEALGAPPFDIPKEVWRLVDHIYTHGMQQADLFMQPGLNEDIQHIRDCLDTGLPTTIPGSLHSVVEALLIFLESLAEPIIPYKYYHRCLDNCDNVPMCREILTEIPDCHRTIFKYLIAFLRELLKHSYYNNLEQKLLATLFGKLFLRSPVPMLKRTKEQIVLEEKKATAYMNTCIAFSQVTNPD